MIMKTKVDLIIHASLINLCVKLVIFNQLASSSN